MKQNIWRYSSLWQWQSPLFSMLPGISWIRPDSSSSRKLYVKILNSLKCFSPGEKLNQREKESQLYIVSVWFLANSANNCGEKKIKIKINSVFVKTGKKISQTHNCSTENTWFAPWGPRYAGIHWGLPYYIRILSFSSYYVDLLMSVLIFPIDALQDKETEYRTEVGLQTF